MAGNQKHKNAIAYHEALPHGKLTVIPTKPVSSKEDLSLAYSPGVAEACKAIAEDKNMASTLTARSNLVAVISNGSAVLGLGNIGPLASKPVMEGKAILFKKMAGVDAFDIEMNTQNTAHAISCVASLEPTFGGINLEDIKAPDCFEIEDALKEKLNIPVFHDDQHGTAIVVAAAIQNGLQLAGKKMADVRLVVSGAGAGALASLRLLKEYGLRTENTFVFDSQGLIHKGRSNLSSYKAPYAVHNQSLSLQEALQNADIFLGLSRANLLAAEDIIPMAPHPLILGLANPVPEIMPEVVFKARPDAMMATGRSDYPNQVNNVLCFPYLFRGALDVGASTINLAMKKACVAALQSLTPQSSVGQQAVLLPQPLDEKLITTLPPAVAKAAVESDVAQKPLEDMSAYAEKLTLLRGKLKLL